jgi:hypothetical protein
MPFCQGSIARQKRLRRAENPGKPAYAGFLHFYCFRRLAPLVFRSPGKAAERDCSPITTNLCRKREWVFRDTWSKALPSGSFANTI